MTHPARPAPFARVDDRIAIDGDCTRIAWRIRQTLPQGAIGLLPATPDARVPAFAMALGRALANQSSGATGILDVNLSWPRLGSVTADEDDLDGTVITRWLHPSLAVLMPKTPGPVFARLELCRHLLVPAKAKYAHVLVDLADFIESGTLLGAMDLTDGVIVFARAGMTREDQLLRAHQHVPPHLQLGVVLVS